MKNSFMLNTFNSLKDAMVDALKTPDWWVYATLIAIFVLLITAIIIIVNCAKKSKKEKDAINASPIETSIEVNTVNEVSSTNEKLENDTSAEVKIEKASTKTQKSSTSKTSTNSASKMDETKKEETADEKKSSETISKPKRTPKVKSIADAVTSDTKKPTSTTTRRTTSRTTSTTTKSSTKSTK